MNNIEKRERFCEKYIVDKEGQGFTLDGREWVRDKMWLPLEGYKLWPMDIKKLCGGCKAKSGQITTSHKPHNCTSDDCNGLEACAQNCVTFCLPRRSGKTFNISSWVISEIFQNHNRNISYIAASEDQASDLVMENFSGPVLNNPTLSRAAEVKGNKIIVPKTNSKFEFLSTSHRSVTGRGRSCVILDEARDISPRVFAAIAPSLLESHGFECKRGHFKSKQKDDVDGNCPVCGDELVPWQSRLVVMSSAGLTEGTDRDWFKELVEFLENQMDKNFYLFRADTDDDLNPDINKNQLDAMKRVLGQLDSMKSLVSVEFENEFASVGDDFVSKEEISRCVDKSLRHDKNGSDRPCVAFLDTSISKDKTSLVICADDEESMVPWEILRVEHIKVWEPQRFKDKIIDPEIIYSYLRHALPMFPVIDFRIDTRAMPWAMRLVKEIKRNKEPWAKYTDGFNKANRVERAIAWNLLEQRIRSQTIKIPPHEELKKELMAVRRVVNSVDGLTDIRDKNRRVRHADIADSLANCCFMAHQQALKGNLRIADLERKSVMSTFLKRLDDKNIDGFSGDYF